MTDYSCCSQADTSPSRSAIGMPKAYIHGLLTVLALVIELAIPANGEEVPSSPPITMMYHEAMQKIGEEIAAVTKTNDLLVILLFDESESLLGDRKVVANELDRLASDLGSKLKPNQMSRLKWGLVSFEFTPKIVVQPTDNISAIMDGLPRIWKDDSGLNHVFEAVSFTTEKFGTTDRTLFILLVTDQDANFRIRDYDKRFLKTRGDAQRADAPIFVLGREAAFQQSHVNDVNRLPKSQRGSPWLWVIPGIESCEQEFFTKDWLFNCLPANSDSEVGSGFGSWSLTTMALLTGGHFFVIRGFSTSYNQEKMNSYGPEWVTPDEYKKRNAASRLRTALRKIVDEWTKVRPITALFQFDMLKMERDRDIEKAKSALEFVDGATVELGGLKNLRSKDAFPPLRWQANYDLAMAQLRKFHFMLGEYIAALEQTKTTGFPKPKPGEKFNYYKIGYNTQLVQPHTGADGLKEMQKAKEGFDQIIRDYEGTPWAEAAKFQEPTTAPIEIVPAFDPHPSRPK